MDYPDFVESDDGMPRQFATVSRADWLKTHHGTRQMTEITAIVERLRAEAEDCAVGAQSATSPQKRDMLERLARYLRAVARDIEATTAGNNPA